METSRFWQGTTIGDAGAYSSDQFSDYMRGILSSDTNYPNRGVLKEVLNELKVIAKSPATTQIEVGTGKALVYGREYSNDGAIDFTISANASGNPRIDLVVLRADWIAQTIRLAVKEGTPAGSPAVPALTQSAGTLWEIPLAQIAVAAGFSSITTSNITDRREFANLVDFLQLKIAIAGRLTLTSNTPVTTSDVTAATTLYFTPFNGSKIALYNGYFWHYYTLTELSIAIPSTTNTNYDVFIYADSAGVIALELTAWSNDTTRATALTTQDGVYVKTGSLTRRYLGTIRTTGVNGQCEDSQTKRFVWNYYNRIFRRLRRVDSTATWTYAGAGAMRSMNNSTDNRVEVVIGVVEDILDLFFELSGEGSSINWQAGIGINSTSSDGSDSSDVVVAGTFRLPVFAKINHYPALGYTFYQMLEGSAAGTATFYGTSVVSGSIRRFSYLQGWIHG